MNTKLRFPIQNALRKGAVCIIVSSLQTAKRVVRDIADNKRGDEILVMNVETVSDALKLELLTELFNNHALYEIREISEKVIQKNKLENQ